MGNLSANIEKFKCYRKIISKPEVNRELLLFDGWLLVLTV